MNSFALSACILASTLGLVACGGSKNSSSNSSETPAVYTSSSCMDANDIQSAGIDLTGVTLINSCVNQNSTPEHLVLEAPVNEFFEFKIDQYEHEKAVANVWIEDKERTTLLIDRMTQVSFPEKIRFKMALQSENMEEIIGMIRKSKALNTGRIEQDVQTGTVISPKDRIDYSFKAKFTQLGEVYQLNRKLYQNDKEADKQFIEDGKQLFLRILDISLTESVAPNVLEELIRVGMAEIYYPRSNEALSFIIKDREAALSTETTPRKDTTPEKTLPSMSKAWDDAHDQKKHSTGQDESSENVDKSVVNTESIPDDNRVNGIPLDPFRYVNVKDFWREPYYDLGQL